MNAPERFKNKAQMATMLKGPLETDDVFLVVGVSLFDLVEDLDLFQTGFVPNVR